ncbi:hypothetical protein [Pseudomonas sp. NFX15]|uniref:hypothetical protein n=1 Tax=Pseudomonas sp. NFX15 TaxID=2816958 RepID=UPI003B8CC85F
MHVNERIEKGFDWKPYPRPTLRLDRQDFILVVVDGEPARTLAIRGKERAASRKGVKLSRESVV